MAKKMTFGLIVGNRGFFPDHLAKSGREEMIAVLNAAGYDVVCPTPEQTKYGAVETRAEAKQCAELFRAPAGRTSALPASAGTKRAMKFVLLITANKILVKRI